MRKLALSLSTAAAFAAPAIATAQQAAPAAPAVPTLDKILDASGLSVSGYIDAAYTRANRNIEIGTVIPGSATTAPTPTGAPIRVFDNQNNSFALHQFGLQVAKQPKEGVGGLVNITAGHDAQIIHSFPEGGLGSSKFDITQGFLQYASGPLTLMAGKFTTLQGSEVIWSPSNNNFSRSMLFGAVPFTHTGVRASYAMGDMATLYAGINNGWDQLTAAQKGKTLELGATLTPIKPLSITVSDYAGQQSTGFTGPTAHPESGSRNSFNAVATYTVMEPLTVGLEYLRVSQKNTPSVDPTVPAGTRIDAKYSGVAGYVSYLFMPKWRASIRVESFKDDDGFHFGVVDTNYKEETLTIAHLMSDSLELRGEIRHDSANKPVFADVNDLFPAVGASTSKSVTTFAFQALYKF
jgi:hypothetical protein